jgi:hypothetical protein
MPCIRLFSLLSCFQLEAFLLTFRISWADGPGFFGRVMSFCDTVQWQNNETSFFLERRSRFRETLGDRSKKCYELTGAGVVGLSELAVWVLTSTTMTIIIMTTTTDRQTTRNIFFWNGKKMKRNIKKNVH